MRFCAKTLVGPNYFSAGGTCVSALWFAKKPFFIKQFTEIYEETLIFSVPSQYATANMAYFKVLNIIHEMTICLVDTDKPLKLVIKSLHMLIPFGQYVALLCIS